MLLASLHSGAGAVHVLRYLGDSHVTDMARIKRQSSAQRDALQAFALVAPRASGPQLFTALELEKIVAAAVDS